MYRSGDAGSGLSSPLRKGVYTPSATTGLLYRAASRLHHWRCRFAVGRHQLSVNGKFSGIGKGDLLAVAERFAIGTAESVLDEVGKVAMHH